MDPEKVKISKKLGTLIFCRMQYFPYHWYGKESKNGQLVNTETSRLAAKWVISIKQPEAVGLVIYVNERRFHYTPHVNIHQINYKPITACKYLLIK